MEKKYGVQARVGERFVEEVAGIQRGRIINRKSKDRVSTKVLSDMIVRHVLFKKIKEDIMNIDEGLLQ